jgi:hypothetical protein
MLVGAMAVLAHARAADDAELLSYRGYDITGEPPNDLAPITAIADDAFARVARHRRWRAVRIIEQRRGLRHAPALRMARSGSAAVVRRSRR